MYEWDESKNRSNKAKHGLGFELMRHFNWDFAVLFATDIVDFEARHRFIAPLNSDLVAVITVERGDKIRVISLRAANSHERKRWKNEYYP